MNDGRIVESGLGASTLAFEPLRATSWRWEMQCITFTLSARTGYSIKQGNKGGKREIYRESCSCPAAQLPIFEQCRACNIYAIIRDPIKAEIFATYPRTVHLSMKESDQRVHHQKGNGQPFDSIGVFLLLLSLAGEKPSIPGSVYANLSSVPATATCSSPTAIRMNPRLKTRCS